MIDVLFKKIYSEVINPEPTKSFFIKNLFQDIWIDWSVLENKLNDFYHLDPSRVELINRKRDKYYPSQNNTVWANSPKVDLEEIFDAFEKGHSLILLNANRMHPSVNEICKVLESIVKKSAVDVHIYCGNKKSKSFYPHCDMADNFIIQQTGKSYWKVYKEYSMNVEKCNIIKDEKELSLDYECVLEPGDLIYIPKSRFHLAQPLEKRLSLSFAISHDTKPINRKWYKFK